MKGFYEHNYPNHKMFKKVPIEDYPCHFHAAIEIECVLSGAEWVTVGAETVYLTGGSMAVAFPYQEHAYRMAESGERLAFIVPLSMLEVSENQYAHTQPETPFFTYTGTDRALFYLLTEPFSKTAPTNGDGRLLSDHTWYRDLARTLLSFHLEHTGVRQIAGLDDKTALLQRTFTYLDAHYDNTDCTAEHIAQETGLSAKYLSALVKQSTGYSLTEHVHNLRIWKAKLLLRDSGKNSAEIAFDSGFSSIRTFNRVFMQHTGMTPTEYRESGLVD